MSKISIEKLKEILHYDPDSGVFTYLVRRSRTPAGTVAGHISHIDGRRRIGLDNKHYLANQLAWFFMTGKWPPHHIDHINGNQADDRFSNLRPATGSQNLANAKRPKHNRSGLKGASWDKRSGKWRAVIKQHRRVIHIGLFDSPEEAHAAYLSRAKELFGEFARAA